MIQLSEKLKVENWETTEKISSLADLSLSLSLSLSLRGRAKDGNVCMCVCVRCVIVKAFNLG